MRVNSIKRLLRRTLPKSVFQVIQKLRTLGHKPSGEVAALKGRFEKLQNSVAETNTIRLRPGIELQIDPESQEPFSWFCWQAPEMVKELDFFIDRIRGAKSFADIGANHGVFSLVFLKLNPAGEVLSVDPSPLADAVRRKNRALNGMDSNLICHQVACGAVEGSVSMHFNWHHLEVSGKGDESLNKVSILVRPLDALCSESKINPEIVKIDVEGFELQVLQGAEGTLKSAKLLLLEIHPALLDKLNVSQKDIFDWLDKRGWRIQTLHGKQLTRSEFCDQFHTFWTVCER